MTLYLLGVFRLSTPCVPVCKRDDDGVHVLSRRVMVVAGAPVLAGSGSTVDLKSHVFGYGDKRDFGGGSSTRQS